MADLGPAIDTTKLMRSARSIWRKLTQAILTEFVEKAHVHMIAMLTTTARGDGLVFLHFCYRQCRCQLSQLVLRLPFGSGGHSKMLKPDN